MGRQHETGGADAEKRMVRRRRLPAEDVDAPPRPVRPAAKASASATSSTTSPRAVLMTIAPGRSRAMRSLDSIRRVARV